MHPGLFRTKGECLRSHRGGRNLLLRFNFPWYLC
jgi:hypothetical protein